MKVWIFIDHHIFFPNNSFIQNVSSKSENILKDFNFSSVKPSPKHLLTIHGNLHKKNQSLNNGLSKYA